MCCPAWKLLIDLCNFSNLKEMDLIEVLWKQDVDLGYNPILPTLNAVPLKEAESIDDIEKLKALLELKTDKVC